MSNNIKQLPYALRQPGVSTYVNYSCRCGACTEAARKWRKR